MKSCKLTRRGFLNNTAGAGMAFTLGKLTPLLFDETVKSSTDTSESGIKYEAKAFRKFMVFFKQLEWITNYDELCELVVEIGFDGFELTVRPRVCSP